AGARGAGIWITVRGVEARALGRVVDVQEDGLIGRGAGGPGRRSHDVAQPAVETDVAGVAVGSIERELRRLGRILPTGSVVAHSSDDDAVDVRRHARVNAVPDKTGHPTRRTLIDERAEVVGNGCGPGEAGAHQVRCGLARGAWAACRVG